MTLFKYQSKRNFKISSEPKATKKKEKTNTLIFVVQKHQASHLHYDFRLEVKGVLKSWAIPKQPSMNPTLKRLAIMVEDHPYDYKDFEGVIPSGYGKGTVKIWDQGTYTLDDFDSSDTEKEIIQGIKKGSFHFTLHGKKLKGRFSLVCLDREKNQWLFIKKREGKKDG